MDVNRRFQAKWTKYKNRSISYNKNTHDQRTILGGCKDHQTEVVVHTKFNTTDGRHFGNRKYAITMQIVRSSPTFSKST